MIRCILLAFFSTLLLQCNGPQESRQDYLVPDFEADYALHRQDTGRTGPIRNTKSMYRAPTRSDWGRASISPGNIVEAGTIRTWTITYIVGPAGLAPGDGLLIYIPHAFTVPQIYEPLIEYYIRGNHDRYIATTSDPGYTTAAVSREGVKLDLWINTEYDRSRLGEGANLYLTVQDKDLVEGDTIRIVYGDTRYGSPGAAASPIEGDFEFPIVVYRQLDWEAALKACIKPGGGRIIGHAEEIAFIERPPIVRVVGREAEWFNAVVPTTPNAGEPFPITLAARDCYRNVAPGYSGKFGVEPVDGLKLPRTIKLTAGDNGWKRFEKFGVVEKPGVYRIKLIPESPFAPVVSNPIVVSESDGPKIYWGELHVHSIESDGNLTADQAYEYGRGQSALDFCTVCDHASGVSDVLRRAATRYNDPGRFVTLNSFESGISLGGHVNFYFRSDSPEQERNFMGERGKRASKAELWDSLKDFGPRAALAIPHLHSGGGWDDFDTTIVRNVEMYSVWGNGEYIGAEPRGYKMGWPGRTPAQALDRGYHWGFVAGGDEHAGLAGWGDWLRHLRTNPAGLAAARTDKLTREAVFDALYDRNVYAVTGAQRIYLNFTIDGRRMGSIYGGGADSHKLVIHAEGTTDIDQAVIVRNGKEWKSISGQGPSLRRELTDSNPPTPVYYYVRVVQKNGDIAWSSPVWFE
ncbi:hypothetical protein ACFLT7_06665 [candidate division KSB1 bacterium]